MQSSARKNGLKQGFHGFTLHSYLLCIGRKYLTIIIEYHVERTGQGNGRKRAGLCEVRRRLYNNGRK